MISYTATYSPEDNKLRLYASTRLDPETYKRVKDAGFIWAPKQDLFVAPRWTPGREDLLIELAGEIDDEDTSLVDRAEDRAERFEGYHEHRAADAEAARAGVAAIADNIPLGQPILVGHHSERRARRDAERIRNGMQRTLKLWETAKYWTARAAGAIRHAKYKERPDVRARRIKTLEAEQRKWKRDLEQAQRMATAWEKLTNPDSVTRSGAEIPFAERVRYVAGRGVGCRFELAADLDAGRVSPQEALDSVVAGQTARAVYASRCIAHLDNRLAYEGAMLAASGWTPPARPKTKADLPLLNYSGDVAYRNPWRSGEIVRTTTVAITKAELAKIPADYKGTRMSEDGTHRLRYALVGRRPGIGGADYGIVFVTDSKAHDRPGDEARRAAAEAADQAAAERESALDEQARTRIVASATRAAARAADAPFEAVRSALRAGVQVVAAPQLFPTPAPLAAQLVAGLRIRPGDRVLEPSAGTGAILRALADVDDRTPLGVVVAVEINPTLAAALERMSVVDVVHARSFLDLFAADLGGRFDCIVMNPPFVGAVDVRHVLHAMHLLAPGGRLRALVAAGPRQRETFDDIMAGRGATWEKLPDGSFSEAGTNVAVALISYTAPADGCPFGNNLDMCQHHDCRREMQAMAVMS